MNEKLNQIKNDLEGLIEEINWAYDISDRLCNLAVGSQDVDTCSLRRILRLDDMIYDIKLNLNEIKEGLK